MTEQEQAETWIPIENHNGVEITETYWVRTVKEKRLRKQW